MKYVQGDLLKMFKEGQFDLIAHQANCFNLMGSGIANAINKEWPVVNQTERFINTSSPLKFATNLYVSVPEGIIVNMYSQYEPGSCLETGLDTYNVRKVALLQCLTDIKTNFSGKRLGIPLVASGVAANRRLKEDMTDLEYFKTFLASDISTVMYNGSEYLDLTVVYL